MKNIIFDVGGDDAGAAALGRYSHLIQQEEFDMLKNAQCRLESRCLTIRSGVVWILETHWKKQFADTRKSIRNMQKKSVGF